MGLDSVELILDVENAFDIQIPDKEAQCIETVGDFYEVVWDKIKDKNSSKCKSAFIFYKLRRILINRYNISKNAFSTDTNLNLILPENNRKQEWNEIEHSLGLKLPKLEFYELVSKFFNVFCILTIPGALLYSLIAINFLDSSKLYFLIPVAGLFLSVLLNYLLSPFKVHIKGQANDIIHEILKLNNKDIETFLGTNRKEMEIVINLIISDKAGVNVSEINCHSRIVKDLGID